MKKVLALIVLGLLGFYVIWPGYTGYSIHAALESENADVLSQKIDFPQVRASIREPVMARLDSRISEMLKDFGGALGVSRDQVKMDEIARIVDGALDDVVSPERLGGIYKRGGDVTGEIQKSVLRQIDNAGGLMALLDLDDEDTTGDDSATSGGFDVSNGIGGLLKNKNTRKLFGQIAQQIGKSGLSADGLFRKRKKVSSSNDDERSFDLANIKHFGFAGPLAMEVGVAADRDAAETDVTARMSFQNFDWKVTRLSPRL